MKRLYLARHAKSSWPEGQETDFDRPLSNRGKKDAPAMGELLKATRKVVLDHVLCSPAKRAKATAKRLLKVLDYPLKQVAWEEIIYSGNETDILGLIQGVDDTFLSLMVIGHNPYITDLACSLSGDVIDDMPTCGVFCMALDVASWQAVFQRTGQQLFFDRPKGI
jgi:phosphohistidine phosphatase